MNNQVIDDVIGAVRTNLEQNYNDNRYHLLLNEFVFLDKDNFNLICIDVPPIRIIKESVAIKSILNSDKEKLSDKIMDVIDEHHIRFFFNDIKKNFTRGIFCDRFQVNKDLNKRFDLVFHDPRIMYHHQSENNVRFDYKTRYLNKKEIEINIIVKNLIKEEIKKLDDYDFKMNNHTIKLIIEYLCDFANLSFMKTKQYYELFNKRFDCSDNELIFAKSFSSDLFGDKRSVNCFKDHELIRQKFKCRIPDFFKKRYYNHKFFKELDIEQE